MKNSFVRLVQWNVFYLIITSCGSNSDSKQDSRGGDSGTESSSSESNSSANSDVRRNETPKEDPNQFHHQRPKEPDYIDIIEGEEKDPKAGTESKAWPFEILSIGHNTASYQNYGDGKPYFHHGLDIRQNAGTEIRASAGGIVVNIENYVPPQKEYWEIAILDEDGFLWQYHHVDPASIPKAIQDAFKNKTKISAGTIIGKIVTWPVDTYGETYHHLHLNVLGKGGKYLNPFNFLEKLEDKKAPVIENVGILKNNKAYNSTSVQAPYSIYATIHDLILHSKFFVPPHEISISIDNQKPRVVWNFDSLPGETSRFNFVHKFFVSALACGNYSCRKQTMDLGFDLTMPTTSLWPTTKGSHSVIIMAKDHVGNMNSKTFEWRVL